MEQRSDEWFQARLGKVTASRLNDVIATIKSGGESASRRGYRTQLVTERLTGLPTKTFVNDAMQHGIDTEDEARNFYIFQRDLVEECGFYTHPTIEMSGASPDGLTGGEDGLIEVKCRLPHNHTETLISQQVPSQYINQMQWQLACTGRKWVDYVSYCPVFPEHLKMFVKRVDRDDNIINMLETEVKKFLVEVDDTVKFLNKGVQ